VLLCFPFGAGFFAFDPAKLQFMECTHIPLAPEAAAVGLDIRVVGNDSGDKMSILSGTIARLDREAPFYGKNSYNDENTFYLQAASGTKGGSSGSPVVDVRGRAVGLNAGSRTKSASAFFLPLQRVARALALLQRDVPARAPPAVPRGTLAATFGYKGFDEARRLGLRRATEAAVRAAAAAAAPPTGMLVVEATVPGGPADKALEAGDVVVRLNGDFLRDFLQLEAALDDSVGGAVTLEVERGGEPMAVTMQVGDAHAGAPDRFLEAWGGVLHALLLLAAVNVRRPRAHAARACVERRRR
jgi:S1-C subfamily serine protease